MESVWVSNQIVNKTLSICSQRLGNLEKFETLFELIFRYVEYHRSVIKIYMSYKTPIYWPYSGRDSSSPEAVAALAKLKLQWFATGYSEALKKKELFAPRLVNCPPDSELLVDFFKNQVMPICQERMDELTLLKRAAELLPHSEQLPTECNLLYLRDIAGCQMLLIHQCLRAITRGVFPTAYKDKQNKWTGERYALNVRRLKSSIAPPAENFEETKRVLADFWKLFREVSNDDMWISETGKEIRCCFPFSFMERN